MHLWADRSTELEKFASWMSINDIDVQNNPIPLTNGTPSGEPPSFYLNNLHKAFLQDRNEVDQNPRGSLGLRQAISKYYKEHYPSLKAEQNVVVVNGAQVGLCAAMAAYLDQGDQVILFQPFYACYNKEASMFDAKYVGVPLFPKYQQSRQSLKKRIQEGIQFEQQDEWTFDPTQLEKAFNSKTRMLIINAPHNPTGKIFSNQELNIIGSILQKYPRVIVAQDNVYESFVYDGFKHSSVSKLSQREEFKGRCVSIYSAGKLLKATGIRLGWVIGSKEVIDRVSAANYWMYAQSSSFLERCVELSLLELLDETNRYIEQENDSLKENRDILVKALAESQLDINLWVPQSGYFLMVNVQNSNINKKYYTSMDGQTNLRDEAFVYQLIYEAGIASIPCCCFQGEDNPMRDKYVRFTFCKDKSTMLEAAKRLAKPHVK